MATQELPVKNLTSPFALSTPVSSNRGITLLLEYYFRYVLAISLVRMRRNSVNSAAGLIIAFIIVFSAYDFS